MSEITSANKEIKPGDIFYMNKGNKYLRVLLCDEYKVFYHDFRLYNFESESLHVKYNPNKRPMNQKSIKYFKNQTYQFVERRPLSEKEYKMLRPDLPLRFGRSKLLCWKSISSLSSFDDLFGYGEEFKKEIVFDKIYILTYGPSGDGKKIFPIDSGKSGNMSVAEIVWRSAQFQVEVFEDDRYGVGIYRLETEKEYPLYILFGYYGRGASIFSVDFGTTFGDVFTLRGHELHLVEWEEVLKKKKKINKTSYKIILNERNFPVKGTEFQLFLMWHPDPVMRFRLSSNEFILDLSDYPPGPYYMLLSNSEKNVYAYWGEYHLIRDDHDGWVYIYPDMKNITKYSKKIEESKKIVIPKIRSNASMKKHEKKLKELLADEKIQGRGEIMDMEEHGFQLHYFDLNETDSHFDALSEQGFQGGGPTWYGIVSGAIQLADPTLNDEIYIDDDSEGIIISSKSKAVLEKMSRLIGILKSEPDLLAASIHIAEKNEMID